MVPSSLQEKFQISVPTKEEAGEEWVTADSARQSQANVGDWCPKYSADTDMRRFNEMPPGMDINQHRAEMNSMPLSLAGETDVSADTNPTALANGFKKREMKGTDDQYTGEHMDLFYGDAGGFVERSNYLDRL